jgi:hypothetical protein
MKRRHRTVHFSIWRALAFIMPTLFVIAFAIHSGQSNNSAPLQLAPPQTDGIVTP